MTTEASELILLDGLVIDPESGEIIEWPDGGEGGPERLEWLVRQHAAASQAIKDYTQAKAALAVQVARILDGAGVKTLTTEAGKATAVAGHAIVSAPIEKVVEAVEAELLTDDEAAHLALFAIKELDPKKVGIWIVDQFGGTDPETGEPSEPTAEQKQRVAMLRLALINTKQSAGYPLITAAKSKPPRLERIAR